MKSVHPIEIQSGYLDTSGYGGGPNDALDLFRAITPVGAATGPARRLVRTGRLPLLDRPARPRSDPRFEQDAGLTWTQHYGESFDVMGLYELSRHNLLVVALELLRLADIV